MNKVVWWSIFVALGGFLMPETRGRSLESLGESLSDTSTPATLRSNG